MARAGISMQCCRPGAVRAAVRALGASLVIATGFGVLAARPVVAQERGGPAFVQWEAPLAGARSPVPEFDRPAWRPRAASPADPITLAMAGLVGSAAGVFGGGYLGYHIDRQSEDTCDYCGLSGLLLGAAVGSAVLTPVAVHMANGARGDLGDTVFASGVITGAGMLLALTTSSAEMLIAVPVAAIISSVALERSTTP